MGRECAFALGLFCGCSLRSFVALRTTRCGARGRLGPWADARRVPALDCARAEGDASTGGCVILIDQRERKTSC